MPRQVIGGTAGEVGEQAFLKVCLPMIHAAAKATGAGSRDVAAMYLGFLSSMFGAMAAEFGQETAVAMLRDTVDLLGRLPPLDSAAGGLKH